MLHGMVMASQSSEHIKKVHARILDLNERGLLDGEVLITQGDSILIHEKSGYVSAYSEPQFMIASCSKQFTAAALLKVLSDQKPGDEQVQYVYVLKQLHRPLIEFLTPEVFAWGDTIPPWAYEITLYHLLTHTSGMIQHIRFLFASGGWAAVTAFINKGYGAEYVIQRWGHEPVEFPAGSAYSYSNLGYELLAKVVSVLAGMPFGEYLRISFFEPLSMHSTYQPTSGTSKELVTLPHFKNLVKELLYDGQEVYDPKEEMLWSMGYAQGSGGIVSTARDLLQWNSALHKEKRVLPHLLYDLYITPHKNNHGLGILHKSGALYYNGKLGSHTSILMYLPQLDLSVIGLWNIDQDEARWIQRVQIIDLELLQSIPDAKMRDAEILKLIGERFPQMERGTGALMRFLIDEFEELATQSATP